jgi:PAS domain S-box-containing protein
MSTILIAYEREMEQNALEKLLSERGHKVIRAGNGVDALDTARRESPQLIISDIVLPKMDGFALLKKWKQDDHLQNVPFVFYTRRHDDPKYERFALELGTDRYVERSTDPTALFNAVDEMLAEGAQARKADTQRLQALSTGSFSATTRIAAHSASPVPAPVVKLATSNDAISNPKTVAIPRGDVFADSTRHENIEPAKTVVMGDAARIAAATAGLAVVQPTKEIANNELSKALAAQAASSQAASSQVDRADKTYVMSDAARVAAATAGLDVVTPIKAATQKAATEKTIVREAKAEPAKTVVLPKATSYLDSLSSSAPEVKSVEPSASTDDRGLAREARMLARMTELDAQNKQLQSNEQRFKQLFEASPVAQWLIDADDRNCTHVNQAALTLYGMTREEFFALPRSSPPFVPGAPIAGTNATWHRNKLGTAIAVELSTKSVELGIRRSEIVAAHDVTSRIFSQQATAHASDAYQALLVAAADGFWLLDDHQRFLDVNEAYCQLSGYSREELLKLSPVDVEIRMPGESTIRLQRLLSDQAVGNSYQTMHRRKNGALFAVEVSVGSVTGAKARSVAIVRDISANQAKLIAEQQMSKAQIGALELFNQAANLDEASLTRRATELCATVTNSPLAFYAASDATRPALLLTAIYEQSRGVATAITGEARKLSPQGPSAQCVRVGHAIIVDDAKQGEVAGVLPAQQSMLLTPIASAEERMGVVTVANRSLPYGEHDQHLIAPIAQALGSILQIKRAHAQTLVAAQRSDIALQGIIEGLSQVVEKHDPYTSGGPRRVAALAVAIARELDLTLEQQDALRTAGLLHGVGNTAIPSALLSKPSALTPAELLLVRTHVEEGCKILSEIQFGSPVSQIVKQHHERLDGSGYPAGLRGDAIMLEARILAIADVVEAMCASRPHRPAPGLEAALAEIEQGAGRLYDPKVATVCLRLFRENGFKLPE